MSKFAIVDDIEADEDDRCYLNHSCLSSFSFGSFDMAWLADSELEAEGMLARINRAQKAGPNLDIVEVF